MDGWVDGWDNYFLTAELRCAKGDGGGGGGGGGYVRV